MHADSEVPNARFPGAEENSETSFFLFFSFLFFTFTYGTMDVLRIATDSRECVWPGNLRKGKV